MADKNTGENPNKKQLRDSFRSYGVYSTIVFQMLAIIGLGFWGGKKLNDYFEVKNNLLTVGIGFLALALALYSTLKMLNNQQKEDEDEN